MRYRLRFVQKFEKKHQEAFLHLEKKFIELEKQVPGFPRGQRFLTVSGKEPSNVLIWESDFDSMEETLQALHTIESNSLHDDLLAEQITYMSDTYTEILREFL